jgi:hypothetical protein
MADQISDMYTKRQEESAPTDSRIERVATVNSYIPPQEHEKLYLSPQNKVKGELRRTFGNPTPV